LNSLMSRMSLSPTSSRTSSQGSTSTFRKQLREKQRAKDLRMYGDPRGGRTISPLEERSRAAREAKLWEKRRQRMIPSPSSSKVSASQIDDLSSMFSSSTRLGSLSDISTGARPAPKRKGMKHRNRNGKLYEVREKRTKSGPQLYWFHKKSKAERAAAQLGYSSVGAMQEVGARSRLRPRR
jgi:hypothetical protein